MLLYVLPDQKFLFELMATAEAPEINVPVEGFLIIVTIEGHNY